MDVPWCCCLLSLISCQSRPFDCSILKRFPRSPSLRLLLSRRRPLAWKWQEWRSYNATNNRQGSCSMDLRRGNGFLPWRNASRTHSAVVLPFGLLIALDWAACRRSACWQLSKLDNWQFAMLFSSILTSFSDSFYSFLVVIAPVEIVKQRLIK